MTYSIKLVVSGDVCDKREVSTDEEMLSVLGKFSIWYYLALDAVDYRDSVWTNWGNPDGSDQLLAFTALKETDKPEGGHRHGLPQGQLAKGAVWLNGKKENCLILIEKKEKENGQAN